MAPSNSASVILPTTSRHETSLPVDRCHSTLDCAIIACGLALCITVDILQYSMPLAFLPSVLEDRGHSTSRIATAIGVYYWTGFLGGCVITSYQIYRVYNSEGQGEEEQGVTVGTARRQIKYLIFGLFIGTVTLTCQALCPRYWVHIACRFVQGFAGAFIFFYTFLLCAKLFKGQQQVFAMTAASTALNVAEVMGSFLGAVIFNSFGQRAVFWTLGVASVMNQVVLLFVLSRVRGVHVPSSMYSPRSSPFCLRAQAEVEDGWIKLKTLMKSRRLGCAVLLISTAAVVKGSIEEILPFHADHRWGLEPLGIGILFSIVALAYITAAVITGQLWQYLRGYQTLFSASFLALLGFAAWSVLAVASYTSNAHVLHVTLVVYGACLGLTHTPAALLLADAIDHEEGPAKEAANGIWNTMWEAGGSVGFLLGGFLADNYASQLELMTVYSVCCVVAASSMLIMADGSFAFGAAATTSEKRVEYGATDKVKV